MRSDAFWRIDCRRLRASCATRWSATALSIRPVRSRAKTASSTASGSTPPTASRRRRADHGGEHADGDEEEVDQPDPGEGHQQRAQPLAGAQAGARRGHDEVDARTAPRSRARRAPRTRSSRGQAHHARRSPPARARTTSRPWRRAAGAGAPCGGARAGSWAATWATPTASGTAPAGSSTSMGASTSCTGRVQPSPTSNSTRTRRAQISASQAVSAGLAAAPSRAAQAAAAATTNPRRRATPCAAPAGRRSPRCCARVRAPRARCPRWSLRRARRHAVGRRPPYPACRSAGRILERRGAARAPAAGPPSVHSAHAGGPGRRSQPRAHDARSTSPNKEVLIVPFVLNGSRRGSRLLAAALGLALAALAPATAQAKNDKHAAADPDACVPDHVLTQPVRRLGRPGRLRPGPGRRLRDRRRGLDAGGGAAVAAGNQPFDIGAPGRSSLALPDGASGRQRPDVRRRDVHVLPLLRPQRRLAAIGASASRCATSTARARAGTQRPGSSPTTSGR